MLLLECPITFLGYTRMMGRALVSTCQPLMVNIVSFLQNKYLLNCRQNVTCGHLLMAGNGILPCKERYPLLLEQLITFLRCIMMIRRDIDSIYEPLMVNRVSFLHNPTLTFHAKCQILDTFSAREMGCGATRRGIYCYLSVP